ncbi:MAG: hypothetical protein R2857_03590 [Vampirovibrionales bacterium]
MARPSGRFGHPQVYPPAFQQPAHSGVRRQVGIDFTYIDDIVQGVLAALVYDQTPYEIVNLGESQRISVKTLIERLEVLTGKTATIDWQPPVPGDVPMTCANIDKARRWATTRRCRLILVCRALLSGTAASMVVMAWIVP